LPLLKAYGRKRYYTYCGIPLYPTSTRETPFQLTYKVNVTILVELGETSCRRQKFEENHNEKNLRVNLGLIHEIREEAQDRVAQYYNMV